MKRTRREEQENPRSPAKGVGQLPSIINLNVYALSLSLPPSLSLSLSLSHLKLFNIYLQKRRDKINQRMKTLQKLVPNSSKV